METTRTTTVGDNKSMPGGPACFECDAPTVTEWREHAFTYGAGALAVELNVTLPVRICKSCGFEFLDHEAETLQHEAICAHLGVLTPKEIEGIRKMHGMSRARFSAVTGLGEATLNRWEKAILIQNTANDRYLRLLALPDNIRRLRLAGATAESPQPSR
jgi:DNA-binding transcriptional regulator YiaG